MSTILLKRIYEPYDETDGCRILVDRIWPRGISKESARLRYWCKDIAPSSKLREWFCHKPELFEEFRERYTNELRRDKQKQKLLNQILETADNERVTILYGAKDQIHNHAVVLYEELISRIGR
ncbi:hypothetical protein A8F94_08850 [Bacillus sp. FJAT-27225]|uniref:DUF488 domain-containing protein n=1 Tax=Bacillus sp. FJAT-27225 TaxID=1743144 RepID=UPI00080C32E8|nr:DUF488 domain-containing protein [Bacillus sp. FJAT-27225]OCA88344.1 hypothetical protein A8F94_08850 [Bacillus sp. FJAT-27225]